MKKFAVILILLIYGSSTAGATVHLHYCMNEFVSWNLFSEGSGTCGKCGMEEMESEGCCKDEQKHFQLRSDHQKANTLQLFEFNVAGEIPVNADYAFLYTSIPPGKKHPLSHAPPCVQHLSLYILNCLFLV